jgi:L-rhamnose isomerase/sugar isomerase
MIQSVVNIQTAYAKALLVDRLKLDRLQAAGDVLGAHRVLLDAYETDVRPILLQLRSELGVPVDPFEAYRAEHADRLVRERAG